MIIDETPDKIKFKDLFPAILLILVSGVAFGAGRLSIQEQNRPGVSIQTGLEMPETLSSTPEPKAETTQTLDNTASVFASSQGKRYYYPGCKNTVSEKNKIFFETKEMAESAGFTLATNCKAK